ncbi:hypothetical protein NEF87_004616 [Candidatus Lokiarchaeum ossiferum]|uniref:Tetratricopeptide repeat protein n=1 Tax=Candidatus Lokiarchaeum ossiferum TaxID=2951803 RepID=A0ABY6I0I9_9ARCH|nr:hypothetical protein NEF87_004616 [Candidatus Lokiarchaeum sp. B-35]
MANEEKLRKKAEVALEKAEILMDNDNHKKSAEHFKKAAELFLELKEWKIAEKCFFYSAKNYHTLGGARDFHRASLLEYEAGKCCIFTNDFEKARDYFDIASKSILKSDAKNPDEMATTDICFAFLCYFVQGKYEEGIVYIKRFKDQIDPDMYSSHSLMVLVRDLTKAIINEREKYIDSIVDNFGIHKYGAAETLLIKEALIVGLASLMVKFELGMDKTEYERDDSIEVKSILDCTRLGEFKNYSILPRVFKSLVIEKMEIEIGDNISTKEKIALPEKIQVKDFGKKVLPFKFRTNFPGEGFIGPITLTLVIDGKYRFKLQSEKQELLITSPNAVLGIDLLPLKTPVINQSFPLQVNVSNNSEGPAMEINVEFEFPEDLRLMRGTLQKNIYSLDPNEDMKWQIIVKAFDGGEIPIKATVSFKDGDGNAKGPFTADLPLNINL